MENQTQQTVVQETRMTAKALFNKDEVKQKFQEILGERASSFMTSVLQIVASSDKLMKADPNSIYHSAAVAATLNLPLNSNLGFAYIVPYNHSYKDKDGKWQSIQVAQFQMGYKGFIQLGQRSGQFKTMNCTDVREGELKFYDRLSGAMEFTWEQDEEKRLTLPVTGFVSYFKLINGFEKPFYMSKAKVTQLALKYSQTYGSDKDYVKEKSRWTLDFEGMALKTVLKLNLSKNAPLSIDMQRAIIADQALINKPDVNDVSDVTYLDNDEKPLPETAITQAELKKLYEEKLPDLTATEQRDLKRIIENNETTSFTKIYKILIAKSDEQDQQN